MCVSTLDRRRVAVAGCHLIALVLLALHLHARTLPPTAGALPTAGDAESVWWGLWPITYAPGWAVVFGATTIVCLIVGFWLRQASGQKQRERRPGPHSTAQTDLIHNSQITIHNSQFLPLILVSLLLIIAFFAFPIVHTRWGDAYLLSRSIAWPEPDLRLTHSWQAPLDVFLHSQLWLLGHERFEWADAIPVYRLLSPLAGAFYLAVVLALSRNQALAPGWLTFGLLTTLGLLQLFFGYVENYSFAAAGILAYLWVGLEVLERRRPLWLAATTLALTNATHPSTVVLAPSLLYLGWYQFQEVRQRNKSVRSVVYSIACSIIVPMAVVAGATVLLMEYGGHGLSALVTRDRPGGADARWFVPLWTTSTRWEHYTLFSWPHLLDLFNQQLLVAPVVWPAILWGIGGREWGAGGRRFHSLPPTPDSPPTAGLWFLAIAAVAYLLFISVWNPDYGGQRDWDLFSLAALPATLWLAALLPAVLPDRRLLAGAAVPLILLQGLHTMAWIYQNTLPWKWP